MAFPTYTYTFSNGTTADATQVNQNFTDILNGVSDGTKDISVNAATAAGTATLNGNVVLGASSVKTITVNGSLASSIPVSTNTTYDFGSATLGLRSVYIGGTSTFTTRIVSGATATWTLTLPVTAGTSGQFLQTDGSGVGTWANAGGATISVVSKTTTYAILTTDDMILCSGSAFTVTLPTAVGVTGKRYWIKKTDSSLTNIITIATTSSQTISGIAGGSYALYTADETLTIVSDGANWVILDHYAVTAFTSAAINLTSTGGGVSKPTMNTDTFAWSRRGDKLFFEILFSPSSGGSAGSGDYVINLPSGLTISSLVKANSTVTGAANITNMNVLGSGRIGFNSDIAVAYATTTTGLKIYAPGLGVWSSAEFSINVEVSITGEIPMANWQP